MCNVHAIRKYGVDLPVSFLGYTSTSCRNSVSSTLFRFVYPEQIRIMKKVKLYIAASIDGFIARNDGDLDWLTEYPNPNRLDYGYSEFNMTIDTVIMGGRTYDSILSMDVTWPYKDKESYIITRRSLQTVPEDTIKPISENIINKIIELKEEPGKNIWLVGGSELISLFMNNSLIDEMIITYIPVILGFGIPLFSHIKEKSSWKVISSSIFDNGVTQTTYTK